MIRRWSLRNFKSFRELGPLRLANVNVLAGANSSGKSSIIQSILLLKQTIQYGSENRPVALNGPLLRLGSFDDVRNSEAVGESLDIGLEFDLSDLELSGTPRVPWARVLRRNISGSDKLFNTISLKLSYTSRDDDIDFAHGLSAGPTALAPRLYTVELKTSTPASDEGQLEFIYVIQKA